MRRRDFLGLVAAAAATPQIAAAREGSATLGFLYSGRRARDNFETFRRGLAATGYVEGRNLTVEYREAGNDMARIPALVAELIRREVDVMIVPGSALAALAAKAATATIPIVFTTAADPVQLGLVASLSRPGGNVTGVSDFGDELLAKRLEFIKLLVPAASRIAILFAPNNSGPVAAREIANAREGAHALGLDVLVVLANTPEEIDATFATFTSRGIDAFSLVPNAMFFTRRARLVDLAARYRVPGIYPFIQFTEIGGLVSYGSSLSERNFQAGRYAGLILNGAKPADLPVHRIERFELAINLTTAKALGLAVPPHFLALADKVIE